MRKRSHSYEETLPSELDSQVGIGTTVDPRSLQPLRMSSPGVRYRLLSYSYEDDPAELEAEMNQLASEGYRVAYFGEPRDCFGEHGTIGGYTVLMERSAE